MGRSRVPKEQNQKKLDSNETDPEVIKVKEEEEVKKKTKFHEKSKKVVLVEDTDEEMEEDENEENEEQEEEDAEDFDNFEDKDNAVFDPNQKENINMDEENKNDDEWYTQVKDNLIIPKYHIKTMTEKIFRGLNLDLKISSKARSLIHLHCEAFLIDLFQQSGEIMDLHKVKTLNKKVLQKVFQWNSKSLLHTKNTILNVKKNKACKKLAREMDNSKIPAGDTTQCELSAAS